LPAKVLMNVLAPWPRPNSVLTFVLFAMTIGRNVDTAEDKSLKVLTSFASYAANVDCCDETTLLRFIRFMSN
jgi:hypothetical protein